MNLLRVTLERKDVRQLTIDNLGAVMRAVNGGEKEAAASAVRRSIADSERIARVLIRGDRSGNDPSPRRGPVQVRE